MTSIELNANTLVASRMALMFEIARDAAKEEEMSEWQDISTAPINYGVRIMAYPLSKIHPVGIVRRACPNNHEAVMYAEMIWRDMTTKIVTPTHWMPLPKEPEL